jgi:Ca2+-binding RTX toxin-like protein
MTAYTFETITPDQAAGFTPGDTLTFATPGATASQVLVTFTPASGGSGIPPSPIIPAKTTLTYNGISRDFPSASLAGYGGSTGQINFPDGSMLYPGTSGADSLQGSGFGDGLYGDFGDDTFNGGHGDDVIQGNAGADVIDFRWRSDDHCRCGDLARPGAGHQCRHLSSDGERTQPHRHRHPYPQQYATVRTARL